MSENAIGYWLVIDTVRIPDAMEVVNQHFTVQYASPLFAGSEFSHLLELSPLLIHIGHDASVRERWPFLVRGHFSSSAVLCHVPESVSSNQLLTHWHSILQVTLNHQRYFIRPYSPMFWRNHAAQLNQDDQSILLGPIQALEWINAQQQVQSVLNPALEVKQTSPYTLTSPVFNEVS